MSAKITPEELLDWRTERHMTQAAAAKALGVSHRTYGNWELGRTEPQRGVRRRVERIVCGDENPGPMASRDEPATDEQVQEMVARWRLLAVNSVLASSTGAISHDTALRMLDEIRRITGELFD